MKRILLIASVVLLGAAFWPNQKGEARVVEVCRLALSPQGEFRFNQFPNQLSPSSLTTVYLASGCFWGAESLAGSVPGVVGTRVGLGGGTTPEPTYEQPGDHRELVEVTFDRSVLSTEGLLRAYQHRSAKLYANPSFYPVSDEHQKYYLRRAAPVYREFIRHNGLDSATAVRVNGYLGGYGGRGQLDQDLARWSLTKASAQNLRRWHAEMAP